jgi:DeoR/GlpR family transcriptional regulator of sugar metabolism
VFAEERHARILELLDERGRVRNSELAAVLGVTEPTVRKDIADLARQQRLRRTHGGAIAVRPAFEPGLPVRVRQNVDAKTSIARACLPMIKAGDAIFIDGGSTALRLAEVLAESPPGQQLNVLTNAFTVARALADHATIRHTVLGGTYRPTGDCFIGPLTLDALSEFTVNVAFIGVTGLSDDVFTVADLGEAHVKRSVIDRARRVVVLMDNSKLGIVDFARVCDLDAVDVIVTNTPTDYLVRQCAERGVELIDADD